MRKKVLIGIFCCICLLAAWAFSNGTLSVTDEKDSPLYARSLNSSIQELLGQEKDAVGNAIVLKGKPFVSPAEITMATSGCYPTTCGQMTCEGFSTCQSPTNYRCGASTCVTPKCTRPTEFGATCAATRFCCK